MCCREIQELENTRRMHDEAALFLSCEARALPKTITVNKLLIRQCRADQALVGHAILNHRRNCPQCNG
jgi:hypothetical protein